MDGLWNMAPLQTQFFKFHYVSMTLLVIHPVVPIHGHKSRERRKAPSPSIVHTQTRHDTTSHGTTRLTLMKQNEIATTQKIRVMLREHTILQSTLRSHNNKHIQDTYTYKTG